MKLSFEAKLIAVFTLLAAIVLLLAVNAQNNRAYNTTFVLLLGLLITVLFAFFIVIYFSYTRRIRAIQQKEIAETTIQAQEKERTEIGKELHDNVNQLLATARLMIETSMTIPEMQQECMQVSKDAVEDAIKEIRAISHSMLPPPFENEAFVDAIKDIANTINLTGNLKVEVQVPPAELLGRIDNNLKLSLYRIIQEQVNNTLKYSHAKTACIKLEVKNDHAHLSIVDNGVGTDLEKRPKGVGLRNIASRVEFHNGELKIKTAPNEGFGLYTRFALNH